MIPRKFVGLAAATFVAAAAVSAAGPAVASAAKVERVSTLGKASFYAYVEKAAVARAMSPYCASAAAVCAFASCVGNRVICVLGVDVGGAAFTDLVTSDWSTVRRYIVPRTTARALRLFYITTLSRRWRLTRDEGYDKTGRGKPVALARARTIKLSFKRGRVCLTITTGDFTYEPLPQDALPLLISVDERPRAICRSNLP